MSDHAERDLAHFRKIMDAHDRWIAAVDFEDGNPELARELLDAALWDARQDEQIGVTR